PISSAFIPAAGSSSSRSLGLAASARASASLRCSPKDRLAASSFCLWPRAENSSSCAISSRTCVCPPSQRAKKPRRERSSGEFCATHRFCQTLSCPKSRMLWKVRAMPSCSLPCTGTSLSGCFLNTISPAVKGNSPAIRLTVVLLPEPLGPIRPTISPSFTVRSSPSTARTPPKWRDTAFSSSTVPPEQAVRPQVHRQDDERAEQEVAPIAEESQSFDEECLNEDHRRERAED